MTLSYVDSGVHDLAVRYTAPPARRDKGRAPIIIVPGYGMNSFIFGFHPSERSLEAALAHHAGASVYSPDLRGSGRSRSSDTRGYGIAELGVDDLGAVVAWVREQEHAERVHLVGCSLGAALAFAYIAHRGSDHVASFVSLGGLVRWVEVPPLLRVAFASPEVMGRVQVRGSRRIVSVALPLILRTFPRLLSLYVNSVSSDLTRTREIVQTVEDPHAPVNEEVAAWIARRDLIVRGVNVSKAIEEMTFPTLCVVAREDGIVPEATGRDVYDRIGAADKDLLLVGGDPDKPIAHADLFLSKGAEERIFVPIARFLVAHGAV
jgi:pimeloyl-ACP methyl ester carboxylesterase